MSSTLLPAQPKPSQLCTRAERELAGVAGVHYADHLKLYLTLDAGQSAARRIDCSRTQEAPTDCCSADEWPSDSMPRASRSSGRHAESGAHNTNESLPDGTTEPIGQPVQAER